MYTRQFFFACRAQKATCEHFFRPNAFLMLQFDALRQLPDMQCQLFMLIHHVFGYTLLEHLFSNFESLTTMATEPRSVMSAFDDVGDVVTGITSIPPFGVETEDNGSHDGMNKTNKKATLEGLKLNIEEPWERSLQRQLEQLPNMIRESASSNRTTLTVSGRSVVPELLLLSRTDSRDYALEMEGCMDDNSSVISRGASPIRRRSDIYRRNSMSNKNARKSLFDSEDDESEANGTCRLSHKFSTESLFLYYDHQGVEDRCEHEDYSDRRCSFDEPRSVLIHRASAVYENESQESSFFNLEGSQQQERPIFDLYLPMY